MNALATLLQKLTHDKSLMDLTVKYDHINSITTVVSTFNRYKPDYFRPPLAEVTISNDTRTISYKISDYSINLDFPDPGIKLDESLLFKILSKIVPDETGFTIKQLAERNRKRGRVIARIAFCYVMRKYSKASLNTIGRHIKRDHSMAIYYDEQAKAIMTTNDKYKETIHGIEDRLLQHIQNKDTVKDSDSLESAK